MIASNYAMYVNLVNGVDDFFTVYTPRKTSIVWIGFEYIAIGSWKW